MYLCNISLSVHLLQMASIFYIYIYIYIYIEREREREREIPTILHKGKQLMIPYTLTAQSDIAKSLIKDYKTGIHFPISTNLNDSPFFIHRYTS